MCSVFGKGLEAPPPHLAFDKGTRGSMALYATSRFSCNGDHDNRGSTTCRSGFVYDAGW